MRSTSLVVLFALVAALAACKKMETAARAKVDSCALLTKDELKEVQGSEIIDNKSSEHSEGGFRTSQCYFAAKEPAQSVSVAITQEDPDNPGKRDIKEYWEKTFEHASEHEKEEKGEKGEEESEVPTKVDGVGAESYWSGSRVGGALYTFKKSIILRISVGGPGDQQSKIEKSKALTKKALERL